MNIFRKLSRIWHRAAYSFEQMRVHPLTSQDLWKARRRWLKWQLGSRLVPGPVSIALTGRARLLVSAGMHGATMNVFTGLADFEEMGFVLHFLRPSDLFVDVGANVGVFGVLAGAAAGSEAILFEPGEPAFSSLTANIRLNGLDGKARTLRKAVSERSGTIEFTDDLDTLNHVVIGHAANRSGVVSVPATTLDDELIDRVPALVKIDVEGFEASVIRGAKRTMESPDLKAVIMELGAHSRRYDIDPEQTFRTMLGFGFVPVRYDPLRRLLTSCPEPYVLDATRSDTIFARDLPLVQERLRSAPRYQVLDQEF